MNKLLIFLFGAACGAAGMMLWLRKDIKNELEKQAFEAEKSKENDQNQGKNGENKDENLPFTVGNGGGNDKNGHDISENSKENVPVALRKETITQYNNIINTNYNSSYKPSPPVPVMPREDIEEGPEVVGKAEIGEFVDTDGPIIDIDQATFEHDHSNEKERLVWFSGDHVMATESGTIIPNPCILVGNQWELAVGKWAQNTAFIRNPKLVTDYEIYVENCCYTDEYGFDDINNED